jgi:hypothetical protein
VIADGSYAEMIKTGALEQLLEEWENERETQSDDHDDGK